MGSIKSPVLKKTGNLALDKITPLVHSKRISNKQYYFYFQQSHTVVWHFANMESGAIMTKAFYGAGTYH